MTDDCQCPKCGRLHHRLANDPPAVIADAQGAMQTHDHRVLFMCECCEEHEPDGAVCAREDIAIMPDGTWLCDNCYSDCDKSAYGLVASDVDDFEWPRFEDFPRPAAYPISEGDRGMREALEAALPHLEMLHSLIPMGDARRFVLGVVKKCRAALAPPSHPSTNRLTTHQQEK